MPTSVEQAKPCFLLRLIGSRFAIGALRPRFGGGTFARDVEEIPHLQRILLAIVTQELDALPGHQQML